MDTGSSSGTTQSSDSSSSSASSASTGSSSAASGDGYTVQSGDTLGGIAAANGTSAEALYAKNAQVIGADPNLIYPGQVFSL